MTNPFLGPWETPFQLPPYGRIGDGDFREAFDAAMTQHKAEIDGIAQSDAAPTFVNTIEAMERAGKTLDRVCGVFYNMTSSHTNDMLQEIEREVAPKLSRHFSGTLLNQALSRRVFALSPEGLSPEQARVLKLYVEMFERAGARLDDAGRKRIADIQARLSELGTAFSQNVLKDEAEWHLALSDDDLDGLPDFLTAQAKVEAESRNLEGYAITLSRSSIEPFLVFSTRRDLREVAWKAWIARGEATNWPLVEETVALRIERAQLL
ncbi:MAG: peptidase M3, partial [Pseudomonadota bacterium]